MELGIQREGVSNLIAVGEQLERLQEIDLKITGLKKLISDLPSRVSQLKTIVDSELHELEKKKSELKAIEDSKKTLEFEITASRDRQKGSEEKLKHVTNNQEYQAGLKEKNHLEKRIEKLESDVLGMIEKSEKSQSELAEAQKVCEEHAKEYETQNSEVKSRLADLDVQVKKQEDLRKAIEVEIPQAFLLKYNRILKAAGGLAVTSVVNGVCKGCQRRLTPQKINLVQKGQELYQCDNCQRFLVYK